MVWPRLPTIFLAPCRKCILVPIACLFCRSAASEMQKKSLPMAEMPKEREEKFKDMRMAAPNIKRQLDKPQTWFVKYFPVRIKNAGEQEQAARQLVWNFKDGKASEAVAETAAVLTRHSRSATIIMPVASSQEMSSWSANAHSSSSTMTGGKGEAHTTQYEKQRNRVFLSSTSSDEERLCIAQSLYLSSYTRTSGASDIRHSNFLTVTSIVRT